jgi:hypothetical protein
MIKVPQQMLPSRVGKTAAKSNPAAPHVGTCECQI